MPTITIGSSRTRESAALMERQTHERTLLDKQALEIKVREAQALPVERFKNPKLPDGDPLEGLLRLLIERGPLSVADVAKPLEVSDATAMWQLNRLASGDKATRHVDARGNVTYAAKMVVEKADSPYKGKKLVWAPKCKHIVTPRDDGLEEVTCNWDYELVSI